MALAILVPHASSIGIDNSWSVFSVQYAILVPHACSIRVDNSYFVISAVKLITEERSNFAIGVGFCSPLTVDNKFADILDEWSIVMFGTQEKSVDVIGCKHWNGFYDIIYCVQFYFLLSLF
jgi:hypothetical protein